MASVDMLGNGTIMHTIVYERDVWKQFIENMMIKKEVQTFTEENDIHSQLCLS